MLEIYDGALPTHKLYHQYEKIAKENNFGVSCVFTGIVREEGGICALSFDIYEPILRQWFEAWHQKIKEQGAILCMAHSRGDVSLGESSFMCAILSSQRKVALGWIEDFIEDFKHRAPIWKYDVINHQRIYAGQRSHKLAHAGILG